MSLKCTVGMHAWTGCRCSSCGKTREEGHDFGSSCKCKICGKVRDEHHIWDHFTSCERKKCTVCGKAWGQAHVWDGCVCKNCNDRNEAGHDWDGCYCNKCTKIRDAGHDWKGCRCRVCGKVRDEGHIWNGCTCKVCKSTRDEQHDWSKDCQICAVCGKSRRVEHAWDGCICTVCGKQRNRAHQWNEDRSLCLKCGAKLDEKFGHSWDSARLEGNIVYSVCRTCGDERPWVPAVQRSTVRGKKVFIPDYAGLNPAYITAKDRALEIPEDCFVLPKGIFNCPICGAFFSDTGSQGAISKFPYAPAELSTMGGYVWWKLVTCCDHTYLIRVEGRD